MSGFGLLLVLAATLVLSAGIGIALAFRHDEPQGEETEAERKEPKVQRGGDLFEDDND